MRMSNREGSVREGRQIKRAVSIVCKLVSFHRANFHRLPMDMGQGGQGNHIKFLVPS